MYLRGKYNLTQREVASLAGISQKSYQRVEIGYASEQSKTSKLVKLKIVDNENVLKRYAYERKKERDKFRIPNIPDFYERLNSLCGEDGRVCARKNPEELKRLRIELGVKTDGSGSGNKGKAVAIEEQVALGRLARRFRGGHSQSEMERLTGIGSASISAIERGQWSSDSKDMKKMLVHTYFDADQRSQLKRAYDRLKIKEGKR